MSSLTAKQKEIYRPLSDENNLEAVKTKLVDIMSLFESFRDADKEYNTALVDKGPREDLDTFTWIPSGV